MRAALAVLMAAAAWPAAGAWTFDEAKPLYDEANALFRQAGESGDSRESYRLYRSAALRYERLTGEGGLRNPKLFYNLGNAYFRMGDWGRSILNYRRALALDPVDADALANLEAARARRPEQTPPPAGVRAARTLLFWHYDWSFAARAALLAAVWGLAWALAAVRLLRPVRLGAIALTGFAAAALAASLAAEGWSRGANEEAVVIAAEAVARKGDGASYDEAFAEPLRSGTEFRLVERRGEWLRGRFADGRTFWLSEAAAAIVGSAFD